LTVIQEIDPANPTLWEKLARPPRLPRLQKLWRGHFRSGHAESIEHPLGPLVQLDPTPGNTGTAWEAYAIPVDKPGVPHILEIDYPSNISQTLAISIIEANAAGAVVPVGLDTGIDAADKVSSSGEPPAWRHHRVIFWPQTTSPILLVANRRKNAPAAFGKIRVLAGWSHLPRVEMADGASSSRLFSAYMDRPMFPENFSATEAKGSLTHLGMDDWVTFYQGGTRLVEYLQHVGYNGLMISVLADGSTIYPSRLLKPTPRYDTGVFLDSARDPVRKDGLEMLFRLFDREGLQLIPALEFAAPLPELEAVLRSQGPESDGMRWVGPSGHTWLEAHPPLRGLAPYYNVLHARVQQAMLDVVREVVNRYGHHPSFAGLAIHLSAHGYAQLPGPSWGMDDATIARFQQSTGLQVPGTGSTRFSARAEYLVPQPSMPLSEHQRQWLDWRAGELARFFQQVHAALNVKRPNARLFLAGANMFSAEDLQSMLRRSLSQQVTIAGSLMQMGIDTKYYRETGGIVLLRPERVGPGWSLAQQAARLENHRIADIDEVFRSMATSGSLFFNRPQELRLPEFDKKCPFQPCYTWLATQTVPSGPQNRQRFVHSLATLDSKVIVDGGWQIPLGAEDSLRRLATAYRRLPTTTMVRLADTVGTSTQPVTVRAGVYHGKMYVYLVNDAPFRVTARLEVAGASDLQVDSLDEQRRVPALVDQGGKLSWTVELEAYGLVAARFSSADVQLSASKVDWPSDVRASLGTQIDELTTRMVTLGNPPLVKLLENPGFEEPVLEDGQILGWARSHGPGVNVNLDSDHKYSGLNSVRISSRGPAATLVSQPFKAPETGRLKIWVSLRCDDQARQPPLRVALVGRYNDADFVRFVHAGAIAGAGPSQLEIQTQWRWHQVVVNDLPLEGLSPLQLRFDLMGEGEVWVDELLFQDLWFYQRERKGLIKMINPAKSKLGKGEVGDCVALMEAYWPRFLMTHVPPAQVPVATPTVSTPASRPKRPERSAGFFDRIRGIVPKPLRF
jgi:hypothetical protein